MLGCGEVPLVKMDESKAWTDFDSIIQEKK